MAVMVDAVTLMVTDDVHLSNRRRLQFTEPGKRVVVVIFGVDEQVGRIKQQTAVGLLAQPIQKVSLADGAGNLQRTGNVFQNQWSAAHRRDFQRVVDENFERLFVMRDWVEMAKVHVGGARERYVLADPLGVGSFGNSCEFRKCVLTERPRRSQRKPQAMDQQRVAFRKGG